MDPDAEVKTIKKMVHEKEHLAMDKFHLKTESGEQLEKHSTIYEAGIKSGDTLIVDLGDVEVNIKLPNHKKIKVSVDPDAKVHSIKEKIKEKEGYDYENYDLKVHGGIISDEKTIHEEGIVTDTTIEVDFHNFNIEIELPTGKTISVSVDPYDKCSVIQDEIKEKEGIDKSKYELHYNDHVLDVTQTISVAGISEESSVTFMYKQITIKIEDRVKGNSSYKFDPMDTISVIKDQLADKKKIAYESYDLKLGKEKLDDEKTLLESNL